MSLQITCPKTIMSHPTSSMTSSDAFTWTHPQITTFLLFLSRNPTYTKFSRLDLTDLIQDLGFAAYKGFKNEYDEDLMSIVRVKVMSKLKKMAAKEVKTKVRETREREKEEGMRMRMKTGGEGEEIRGESWEDEEVSGDESMTCTSPSLIVAPPSTKLETKMSKCAARPGREMYSPILPPAKKQMLGSYRSVIAPQATKPSTDISGVDLEFSDNQGLGINFGKFINGNSTIHAGNVNTTNDGFNFSNNFNMAVDFDANSMATIFSNADAPLSMPNPHDPTDISNLTNTHAINDLENPALAAEFAFNFSAGNNLGIGPIPDQDGTSISTSSFSNPDATTSVNNISTTPPIGDPNNPIDYSAFDFNFAVDRMLPTSFSCTCNCGHVHTPLLVQAPNLNPNPNLNLDSSLLPTLSSSPSLPQSRSSSLTSASILPFSSTASSSTQSATRTLNQLRSPTVHPSPTSSVPRGNTGEAAAVHTEWMAVSSFDEDMFRDINWDVMGGREA
ncbi:hypothetical protein WAI453_013706 [Rhynchosporium graminicola]